MPEAPRFASAIFWKMLRSPQVGLSSIPQALDTSASYLPSMSPALSMGLNWAIYGTGNNPYDYYKGRSIIPDTEFKAGGAAAARRMFDWSLDQTGLFNVAHYDTSKETTMETAVRLAPGVKRFVKITNYGMQEEEKRIQAEQDKAKAREVLSMPAEARRRIHENEALERKAERRTVADNIRKERLSEFNKDYLFMRKQIVAADKAGNDERTAFLRERIKNTAFKCQ